MTINAPYYTIVMSSALDAGTARLGCCVGEANIEIVTTVFIRPFALL